jgi:hypothetical protein
LAGGSGAAQQRAGVFDLLAFVRGECGQAVAHLLGDPGIARR